MNKFQIIKHPDQLLFYLKKDCTIENIIFQPYYKRKLVLNLS